MTCFDMLCCSKAAVVQAPTSAKEHSGNNASIKVTPAGHLTACEMMASGRSNSKTFILSRSSTCVATKNQSLTYGG
jgi:hypothetical protein